jgi:3-hydroxymyristoyl/3-hydroxydecanoyl-(acyl carrier protein) dehydratase
MKSKRLVYLGFILAILGTIWLLNITSNVDWYVEHISNTYIMSICIISSIMMAAGGYIMLFAYLDR